MGSLSEKQLRAIEDTERACSVLSLLGTAFIIGSFLYCDSFRKPINRLVFFASWGNVLSNVATLISRSGIFAGVTGPLCQFQGFLLQWFMPADALWTFAMACNVYLTFFHKYDASQLRRLEWKYFIFCYGVPFLPAFVYLFIETKARGKIYGSATLWCWVSPEWDALRLAVFYGPVWLIVILTFAIYITTGREIFNKRQQLRHANSSGHHSVSLTTPGAGGPQTIQSSRTTEIRITTETANTQTELADAAQHSSRRPGDVEEEIAAPHQAKSRLNPYSVVVESAQEPRERNSPVHTYPSKTFEANKAAWAYSKCAMLFFMALLITWVPSSLNRIYALAQPDKPNFALNYLSAFVLPLQGFWNSVIYVSMSFPAVRKLFLWESRPKGFLSLPRFARPTRFSGDGGRSRSLRKNSASDSTRELTSF